MLSALCGPAEGAYPEPCEYTVGEQQALPPRNRRAERQGSERRADRQYISFAGAGYSGDTVLRNSGHAVANRLSRRSGLACAIFFPRFARLVA